MRLLFQSGLRRASQYAFQLVILRTNPETGRVVVPLEEPVRTRFKRVLPPVRPSPTFGCPLERELVGGGMTRVYL